ncbi:hypothetical protein AXF42_Ash017689 [Apostasia shenzhenica]|uniref:Uncharacterized protein n=1 Tax=Apostasia shenzhenica TaxID=1088818 RepID=A0A2I0B633_9ASPA|nr:hypothetical protein AXF42_Ash017689 [Apostasia shenzhenica]
MTVDQAGGNQNNKTLDSVQPSKFSSLCPPTAEISPLLPEFTATQCFRPPNPRWPRRIAGEILRSRFVRVSLFTLLLFTVAVVIYSALTYFPSIPRSPACDLSAAGEDDRPAPTNLSHIVFGIGGSARTWHRRRAYSELWWRPGEMRGHVWLDEAPADGDWPVTCPPWRVSAPGTARYGERAAAARMARIAAESYAMRMEGVRWFVMGDDDTVFFPENLAAVLGKYDHEQMYYIGAPSESVEQNEMHSYAMAFGGGGFAVSHPAAQALAGAMDGCLERYSNFYGSDQRVQACLSDIGIPLTTEPGFHQVDLRGDAYGLLAAHPVAALVSLHHLDYLPPILPFFPSQFDALRSLVSVARADPPRALQQCSCYLPGRSSSALNWSVSVSWGYTAQIYPWLLPPTSLELPLRTFQTWRSFKDGPFIFNTRELASPDRPCERPLRFFLQWVVEGRNRTVTEYKSYQWGDEGRKECRETEFRAAAMVDSVRVLAPKLDPNLWKKAPRRQCCEARRRGAEIVEVRIRHCRAGEAAFLP